MIQKSENPCVVSLLPFKFLVFDSHIFEEKKSTQHLFDWLNSVESWGMKREFVFLLAVWRHSPRSTLYWTTTATPDTQVSASPAQITEGGISPLNLRFFGNFFSGFEDLISLCAILRHLEAEFKAF
jgi:hypothetical protein